jgi:hypothetical protein
MRLHFSLTLSPQSFRIKGLLALLIVVGIFMLPHFFASSLDEKRAIEEIRQYLKRQHANDLLEEVKASGKESPDLPMAQRWEEQSTRSGAIEFSSVEINRFVIVPPFTSFRMFVVKAVMRFEEEPEETRYFTLSSRSKLFDVFWVSELSWIFWLFSV